MLRKDNCSFKSGSGGSGGAGNVIDVVDAVIVVYNYDYDQK